MCLLVVSYTLRHIALYMITYIKCFFFFSSRRRHTRSLCDWSSDVCSSDLASSSAAAMPARSAADGLGTHRLGGRRRDALERQVGPVLDRKSTRLNSSHTVISYAVFCSDKKR